MAPNFGECCEDLADAMHEVPDSFFRVEDNGVLYFSVGSVETEEGPAFLEMAVLHCPFCGIELQKREDIPTDEDQ